MIFDIEKVDAARRGDKDSFSQVYESIAPDLYKVALYTLGNAHDAEDVVSETFIEAYRGIAKLREPSSFRYWIFKILSARCKHKIAEYIKGKSAYDFEAFSSSVAAEGEVSSDVAERVALISAMSMLSEQERLIVVLSVINGYTTREIAKILGSPTGTISSKLHRALVKLRKILSSS